MPFTPYHFGPHLLVGLIFIKFLDIPTFLASNILVDLQPLLVLAGWMEPPLHGISHTFLGATVIGLILGIISIPFMKYYTRIYSFFNLKYSITKFSIILSGILGAWFHVITDTPIYDDINPFYPLFANPVKESLTYHFVANFCLVCFIPALALLFYRVKSKVK